MRARLPVYLMRLASRGRGAEQGEVEKWRSAATRHGQAVTRRGIAEPSPPAEAYRPMSPAKAANRQPRGIGEHETSAAAIETHIVA